MARLKRKVKKRIITLIFLLVIILLGFVGYTYIYKNNNNSIKDKVDTFIKEKKEDPIKTYKASLIATGDGLAHMPVYKAAYNSSDNTYDFSNMLTYTKDKISSYDIKYYNQETVSDDTKAYSGYPMFNTPSGFGKSMVDAGFNLVSLSSNHSMDMGASSAKNSALFWESLENVISEGMYSKEEERLDTKIGDANGISYAMLSYTYGTNGLGGSSLTESPYLVNVYSEELVKEDVERLRDKVDVLIVSMHWGNEYSLDVTDTQKKQAEYLSNLGVDIILGTHSHCLEPFEKINDTVVFYSLGNFISNQMGAENANVRKVGTVGVFATLDITKVVDTENDTTTITIDNIGADLNYTYRYYNSNIAKNDYLVIPFSKMEEKYLSNYESIYNEFSTVLKKYDDSIIIESLPN